MPQLDTTSEIGYPDSSSVEHAPRHEFPAASEAGHSIEYLRHLWEHRALVARFVALGLVLSACIALLLPRRYVSVTTLMPPDRNASSGMLAALSERGGLNLTGVAGDLFGLNGSGALFVGILQSKTVQDRLVQRFALMKVHGAQFDEDARKDLAERTSVTEDRKTGIIAISVTDRSPQLAMAIANAYVEELNRLVVELSTSAAHRERVFLEERLQSVQKDLDQAARDFGEFASKNTTIDIKEQGRAMVDAAARLQGELIAAQSELRGLEQIYSAGNVRVRSTRARIVELQKQLDKLGGQPTTPSSGAPEDEASSYPSIRQLPILGVTYSDLYRRTKVQEAVYETLTQQYELAKVEEAKETPSVKVLDPATLPHRKSFPPRALITMIGGIAGLFVSSFYVCARARWRSTDVTDPRKVLFVEVLQTVRANIRRLGQVTLRT